MTVPSGWQAYVHSAPGRLSIDVFLMRRVDPGHVEFATTDGGDIVVHTLPEGVAGPPLMTLRMGGEGMLDALGEALTPFVTSQAEDRARLEEVRSALAHERQRMDRVLSAALRQEFDR